MGSTYFDTNSFGVPFPQQNQRAHNFTNNQAAVRRAYYGCISYVDSLIGDLLAALKAGGAEQHTAVVFTGDQ
jgi:arylsulfatase A-like enzyme